MTTPRLIIYIFVIIHLVYIFLYIDIYLTSFKMFKIDCVFRASKNLRRSRASNGRGLPKKGT